MHSSPVQSLAKKLFVRGIQCFFNICVPEIFQELVHSLALAAVVLLYPNQHPSKIVAIVSVVKEGDVPLHVEGVQKAL